MKKIKLIGCLICALGSQLNAQKNTASLSIHFESANEGDSVFVQLWKYNLKIPLIHTGEYYLAHNNAIEIRTEQLSYPVYLSFAQLNKTFYLPTNLLVEPNDSVHIEFGANKVICTGRGAKKIQLQYDMNQLVSNMYKDLPKIKSGQEFIPTAFPSYTLIYQAQTKMLEQNRNRLSKDAYQILSSNLFYDDLFLKLSVSNFEYYRKADSVSRNLSGKVYQKYWQKLKLDLKNYKSGALAHTFNLADFMIRKFAIDTFVMRDKPFDLSKTYRYFKNTYQGFLRDRLISTLLIKYNRKADSTADCLRDALSYVKDTELKEALAKEFYHFQVGAPVFNFSLVDVTGRKVRLSDFKNKTVLIDTWFTGCNTCILVSNALKPIEESYQNEKNLVFLSISVDPQRDTWINSIQKGLYTSPDRINLFTNGNAENDAFIQYYNIHSFPTLLLIDRNGNLISGKLPLPHADSGEALKELIKKTLSTE